jgi:hypothetical protein
MDLQFSSHSEETYLLTALRETFEEVGLLLFNRDLHKSEDIKFLLELKKYDKMINKT